MHTKKLYLLILKSYLGPLVLTFFIAVFILLMQFLWKWVDELVGKGLEWHIVAELLFYASFTFVPMALPISILLASLMTFGNLGERYELVAMKAAGISLRKIMAPLVYLSVAISISAFLFSNYLLPIANLKFRSILYDVRQTKLAFSIKEGIYYDGIDGYVIRVGKKDKDEKTIRDIMIYDHKGKTGNSNLTIADSGTMEMKGNDRYLILTLYNGINYYEKTDRHNEQQSSFRQTSFKQNTHSFDMSAFALTRTNEELFRNNYQMLNLEQLDEAIDSLNRQIEKKRVDFTQSFMINMYYYSNKLDTNICAKIDTSGFGKLHEPGDLLSGFSRIDKVKIIENALNSARNLKVNIGYHSSFIKDREKLIVKHRIEWQRKFTLSFACIVLFFIGAPFGIIIRKGGLGLPLVVSIVLFVLYHIISTTGFKYAKEGMMSPFGGMWLASAVFLPFGIMLTIKATTDSPILDTEAWKKFFSKTFALFNRKSGK